MVHLLACLHAMATLQFKGKNIVWNHHLAVPYHTLEEVPELAHRHPEADPAHDHLIVEADNLLALRKCPKLCGRLVPQQLQRAPRHDKSPAMFAGSITEMRVSH